MKVLVAIPILAYRAWVFSVLWRWFVTPITGWEPISVAVAFGLTCIVVHFSDMPDPDRDFAQGAAFALTASTMALGLGWVALQFA